MRHDYQEWLNRQILEGNAAFPFEKWRNEIEYPRLLEEMTRYVCDTPHIGFLQEKTELLMELLEEREDWDESEDIGIMLEICEDLLKTIQLIHGKKTGEHQGET